MKDEEEDQVPVMLCDACSDKLTGGENWLGTMPLKDSFECMICHQLCCSHLLAYQDQIEGEASTYTCKVCVEKKA